MISLRVATLSLMSPAGCLIIDPLGGFCQFQPFPFSSALVFHDMRMHVCLFLFNFVGVMFF